LSTLSELRAEIQPTSPSTLLSLSTLCHSAFTINRKTYIKRRAFPFLYLMTLLSRADLRGLELETLVVFQAATGILSSILESGAAGERDLGLLTGLYTVLGRSGMLPMTQGGAGAYAPQQGLGTLAYGSPISSPASTTSSLIQTPYAAPVALPGGNHHPHHNHYHQQQHPCTPFSPSNHFASLPPQHHFLPHRPHHQQQRHPASPFSSYYGPLPPHAYNGGLGLTGTPIRL
jgi:hypothetical protein